MKRPALCPPRARYRGTADDLGPSAFGCWSPRVRLDLASHVRHPQPYHAATGVAVLGGGGGTCIGSVLRADAYIKGKVAGPAMARAARRGFAPLLRGGCGRYGSRGPNVLSCPLRHLQRLPPAGSRPPCVDVPICRGGLMRISVAGPRSPEPRPPRTHARSALRPSILRHLGAWRLNPPPTRTRSQNKNTHACSYQFVQNMNAAGPGVLGSQVLRPPATQPPPPTSSPTAANRHPPTSTLGHFTIFNSDGRMSVTATSDHQLLRHPRPAASAPRASA